MNKQAARLALVSTLVGCLELAGCQYRSKNDTYVLIASNLKVPYWKSVQDGFQAAAEEYSVTARVDGPATYDPAAEAEAFTSAVNRHPAGILISAADAGSLGSEIGSAISAGIPVITVDSDAPLSARLYFIGTNNLEAGQLGGKRLVDRLNGKGNVVVFTIPGQPNLEDRLRGYMDAIASTPAIKIVDVASTRDDANSAFEKTKEYASRTGAAKIDAFVCLESTSGANVADTLRRANITDRVIIAMDVEPETLKYVADGTIDSTILQKPWTMGYVGLKALDEVHRSRKGDFRTSYQVDAKSPYPAFVDTGSALVTKYNVTLFQQVK